MRTIPDVNENADLGILWTTDEVAKGTGPSKVVVCDYAQIPVIVDVEKFRAAFGDDFILASMDGSSLRVQAQAVARRMAKDEPAAQRQAVLNLIRGTRNVRKGVREIVVREFIVPSAEDFSDVTPVRAQTEAELAAAIVDAGWTSEQALKMANRLWNATK